MKQEKFSKLDEEVEIVKRHGRAHRHDEHMSCNKFHKISI